MADALARSEERRHFDSDTRITLLERDADEHDRATDRFEAKLNKIMWALVGLLISVSTACVLLAINLTIAGKP